MTKKNNHILNNINHFEVLFDSAYDPILVLQDHSFIDCNKAALKILDISSKEELFKLHPSQISPEFQPCGMTSKDKANQMIDKCYKEGFNRFEWVHKTAQDKKFWVEVSLKTIQDEQNDDLLYVAWRDISKRK